MRFLRWGAFVTWLIVTGLAVAGFAAFSPGPAVPDSTPSVSSITLADGRGAAAGRVLALAFAVAARDAGQPVDTALRSATAPTRPALLDPSADSRPETTTTTAAPTTTRAVAPSTESAGTTIETEPTVPVGRYQWPNGSRCQASWYGPGLEGRPTASGEPFDPTEMTAAMHDVPLGTLVIVRSVATGETVTVRVNDRGPYIWDDGWARHPTRCIDLSEAAMRRLGGLGEGVMDVTIKY